jgi:hypothetical protein
MTNDADRAALIARIAALPAELSAALAALTPEQFDARAAHDPWNIRQVVHHIADSHMNAFIRMKLMLTEDHPTLKPYNQDAWSLLADAELPIEVSLTLLQGLHARWAALFAGLKEADWARSGHHPEYGTVTVGGTLKSYVAHGDEHLEQIRRIQAGLA